MSAFAFLPRGGFDVGELARIRATCLRDRFQATTTGRLAAVMAWLWANVAFDLEQVVLR